MRTSLPRAPASTGSHRSLASRIGSRVHAVVVAVGLVVAVMLGGGSGLPGIVWSLSGAGEHVCTCASGGSHASCPVCSHALQEPSRSHRPSIEGLPCGDPRFAAGPACEVATLPPAGVEIVAIASRVAAPPACPAAPSDPTFQPVTPPPRNALPG